MDDIDAFLKAHYSTRGINWCAAQLKMSPRTIRKHRDRLGLRCRPVWTDEERKQLAFLWAEKSLTTIARELRRSPNACYREAGRLGLGRGVPRGMENICKAAERCGYNVHTLRKILAWGQVEVYRAKARPKGAARARPRPTDRVRWVVHPDSVDEAVERWLASEYVGEAGKRLGVNWGTLARHLEADPRVNPRPRSGQRWRVNSTVLEEVAAKALASRQVWMNRRAVLPATT